jgi:hypothetical protein
MQVCRPRSTTARRDLSFSSPIQAGLSLGGADGLAAMDLLVWQPRPAGRARNRWPLAILSMQAGEKFHFLLLRQLNSQNCSSCCSGAVRTW